VRVLLCKENKAVERMSHGWIKVTSFRMIKIKGSVILILLNILVEENLMSGRRGNRLAKAAEKLSQTNTSCNQAFNSDYMIIR
jgi:hypothetical protein